MIKKITALFLIFAIIASVNMTTFIAFASDTTLTISSVHGEPDTNVNISVNISANSGLAAGDFILHYDTSKLDVISAVTGGTLTGGSASANTNTVNGTIIVAFAKEGGINGAGSILDVAFRIKSTASGSIPLTLNVDEIVNEHFETIPYSVMQGIIVVDMESTTTPSPTPTPTPTPTQTTEIYFPDLDSVDWAKDAIYNLAKAEIIKGYEDGTFKPENSITRAECIKIFVLAFDIYDQSAVSEFSDVPSGEWYNSYVASAEISGLTKGNGDGKFTPDSTITREEVFILCARAMERYKGYELLKEDSNEIGEQLGKFVEGGTVSDWAKSYVASDIKYGLVTGSDVEGGKAIYPQDFITRAEAVVVLYRTM